MRLAAVNLSLRHSSRGKVLLRGYRKRATNTPDEKVLLRNILLDNRVRSFLSKVNNLSLLFSVLNRKKTLKSF